MADGDVRTTFHRHSDGSFTILSSQDVEPILEHNKQLQTMPQKSDWGRHVASIPNGIWLQWHQETNGEIDRMDKATFSRFLRRKLADPAYSFLRTS